MLYEEVERNQPHFIPRQDVRYSSPDSPQLSLAVDWHRGPEGILLIVRRLRPVRVAGGLSAELAHAAAPQCLARIGSSDGVNTISVLAQSLGMAAWQVKSWPD